MALKRLTFGKPTEVTNPGDDSRSFLFPFSVVPVDLVGAPEESQSTTAHRLIVTIQNNRLTAWQLSDPDLVKVLFEIGQREVTVKAKSSQLKHTERQMVSTASHSRTCPFAPSGIHDPDGAVVEVEEERRIGFK